MHLPLFLLWLLAAVWTVSMVIRVLWHALGWLFLGPQPRLAASPYLIRGSHQGPQSAERVPLTDRERDRRWAAVRGEREDDYALSKHGSDDRFSPPGKY